MVRTRNAAKKERVSELALFVAATLRDRAVSEVQDALEREKQANADFTSITLFKSNGEDEDEEMSNQVVWAKGLIPEGEYVDQRGGFFGSLLWKVNLVSSSAPSPPFPPTMEAMRSLKAAMGGGWIKPDSVFGEFADPHVVPAGFDASTLTGRFELTTFGSLRVQNVVLAISPIRSEAQYNHVVGPYPGGLYSRLVQWVEEQEPPQQATSISVVIESVSLDANSMKSVFTTLGVPPPPPRARHNNWDHAQWAAGQAIYTAQMNAHNAQMRASNARAAEANVQLRQQMAALGFAVGGDNNEED